MTTTRVEIASAMSQRAAELDQLRAAFAEQRGAIRRAARVMGDHDPLGKGCKFDPHVGVLLPLVGQLNGDAEAAMVASQICYWLSRRQIPQTGIRLSHQQLMWETGLSKRATRRAIEVLIDKDYVRRDERTGRYCHGSSMADAIHWIQRRLVVTTVAVEIAGSAIAALVLTRVCAWFGRAKDGACRAQIIRAGQLWVAKSCEELAGELFLSARQVRHAVAQLRRRGMLNTTCGWWGGRKVLHLRPEYEAITDAKFSILTKRWEDESAQEKADA